MTHTHNDRDRACVRAATHRRGSSSSHVWLTASFEDAAAKAERQRKRRELRFAIAFVATLIFVLYAGAWLEHVSEVPQ